MARTTRSRTTATVVLTLCALAPAICGAQRLAPAPVNPEFIAYWDARLSGVWETVTGDGHGLGYIPAPANEEGLATKPLGIRLLAQPASYDLRSIPGKLPPVRDQGACGSCWAFGSYSSAESCLRPTDTSDLSENHLKNTHGFDWSCCSGGNAYMSAAYMTRWGGPVFESDDPYNAGSCSSPPGLSARKHAQEILWLPARSSATDNDFVKNAVVNHGAVFMAYYHSNLYYNSTNKAYYYNGSTSANHAVAIVGWDDNYPSSNFNTDAPGNGAFIVRNSWGAHWGENGYFYMSYYDTRCGYFVVFSNLESAANYNKIHQYDPYGRVSNFNNPWAANVFQKGASVETLGAVGFYTPAANMPYEVRVYRNPTSGPTGGSHASTETGTCTYAGFHTITLTNPVALAASDTSFAVWVNLTGAAYPSAGEHRASGYCSSASAAPGQSYYSFDGASWTDLTSYISTANFCIKAYTKTGPNTPPTDPTSVTISPSSPNTADNLTASASGSIDPDGGSPSYVYQWAKMPAGGSTWEAWGDDGPTLDSSKTSKGEQWKAQARAFDGGGHSNWVESSPVAIGNTAPTDPTGVDVSPGDPTTADDLTASASGSIDPDGGPPSYVYQWAKMPAGESSWEAWGNDGPILASSNTSKGEQWKARAQAFDGAEYSNWVESSPVTIGNTPPTDPTSVDVSPSSPQTGSDLTVAARGSTDPDSDDSLTYEYQWAQMAAGGSSWGAWGSDGPTLDSSNTSKGERWKARARAFDGTEHSNWVASSPVRIRNTPPRVEWVGTTGLLHDGVHPNKGKPSDTAFRFAVKLTDPDETEPASMTVVIRRLQDRRRWVLFASLPLTATSGTSWSEGKVCEASATLPNGVYVHRFIARDDASVLAGGDPATWHVGPKLDAAPQLWCTAMEGRTGDFVHPNTGTALQTRFIFSVQYTDGDGRLPRVQRIELQRKRPDGSWRHSHSGEMAASGGSPTGGKYYNWKRKLAPGEYRHRFVFADHDGAATGSESRYADATEWQPGPTVTEPTSDAVAGSTAGTALASLSATPSPAGAQITISLTCAAEVHARVLNVAGRQVKTICRGRNCAAGTSTLVWNAQSDSGLRVPSGVYLIEVVASAPDGRRTRALSQVSISR